jgi:acyl-CoA reductase-like NAD-dependent aldehyde dehydrogenase
MECVCPKDTLTPIVLTHRQYPYLTLINSLVPALLCGNPVILKPSPQTPTSAEQIQKIFSEAGLPDGVLQIFHSGSITQIEAISRSPHIQLVCFTGSVANGLAVQSAANDRVPLRVGLELGGKDPAYVRSDVDIKWAAEEIVDGAIFNSGQSCCSVERVYVDEKIHDEFVSAVQEVLKGYKLGDPFNKDTQIGPMVSKRSVETVQAHIKDALEKGAKNATPENETFKNPPTDGNYVAPTLLTGVTHEMAVMTEETFGPIIPVMKVKDDAEAIRLMNDSQFGLTASIWTKDTSKGHELVDDVEAGTVFVNRCDYPAPVSFIFRHLWCLLIDIGSCLGWMEGLWKRTDFEQVRVRSIRQAQELPRQGLPQIGARCTRCTRATSQTVTERSVSPCGDDRAGLVMTSQALSRSTGGRQPNKNILSRLRYHCSCELLSR